MQNVEVKVEGDFILLRIDTKQKAYDTAKTEVVASSGGWQPLAELPTIAVNLTVCRKRGGAPWRQKAVVS